MSTVGKTYPDPWETDLIARSSQLEEATPEVNPVFVCEERCTIHNFALVSMPRNKNQDYNGLKYKCPLVGCLNGIERHI